MVLLMLATWRLPNTWIGRGTALAAHPVERLRDTGVGAQPSLLAIMSISSSCSVQKGRTRSRGLLVTAVDVGNGLAVMYDVCHYPPAVCLWKIGRGFQSSTDSHTAQKTDKQTDTPAHRQPD
jgi:hypothetical protein